MKALSQVIWKIVELALTPINHILLIKYGKKDIKHQPIFIIGAPRTGSTILYQSLTNSADVSYIDNLTDVFYRNLVIGFLISRIVFSSKAHNCFRSEFGSTRKSGLRAPSECGKYWYRWLPKHKHFIDRKEISYKSIFEIKKEIKAVTNMFERPVVFKNLNIGQRLRMIKDIFPGARFIFITRNPFFTAQSILNAKRSLNLGKNYFWSVMPKNVEELRKMTWHEQIAGQIYHLERQIIEDLNEFTSNNIKTVGYSDMSEHTINELIKFFNLKERKGALPPKIKVNNSILIAEEEYKPLSEAIDKYNWPWYEK